MQFSTDGKTKPTRYGDYDFSNSVTAVTLIHKIHNEFDIIFLINN